MTEARSPEDLDGLREHAWDDWEDGDRRAAFIAMDAVASEAIHQLRLALAAREQGGDVVPIRRHRLVRINTGKEPA